MTVSDNLNNPTLNSPTLNTPTLKTSTLNTPTPTLNKEVSRDHLKDQVSLLLIDSNLRNVILDRAWVLCR